MKRRALKRPAEDRRRRFVEEYCKDQNGARAATAAGYAPKSARVTASRLLSNANVSAQVRAILDRVSETNMITIERTAREIARLAYGDRRKLYDESGNLVNPRDMDEDTAALLSSIETEERVEGKDEDARVVVTRKVKTWDKGRALEQCMAILGMHKSGPQETGKALSISINLSGKQPKA